jgi:hypothetical protein
MVNHILNLVLIKQDFLAKILGVLAHHPCLAAALGFSSA